MKKTRRDAKLKGLPQARQAEVIRIAEQSGITETTLDAIRQSLGIEVRSLKTLSEFWHWWHEPMQRIARELETAGSVTDLVMQRMRESRPDITPEALHEFGQRFFAEQAIALQDPKAWAMIQGAHRDKERVALKAGELDLARQRFRRETAEMFLQWYEDQRARDVAGSGASQAEKIERLGELMFGEDWK